MIPREIPFTWAAVDRGSFARLRAICLAQEFLPTFCHGLVLQAAMVDPADPAALAVIRQATHQEVRPFGITRTDFEMAVAALAANAEADRLRVDLNRAVEGAQPPIAWLAAGRSAREVASALTQYAFEAGASDLLLDDQERWLDVAIKRSGRKEMLPPIERERSPAIFRAFKEIAGLSTQTVLGWQTGAARFQVGSGRWADLRIEIAPTVQGESLVARVQDREKQIARMRQLPFREPRQCEEVGACLRQSQGLIVATGPTGQGKTTTLYSCLGQLDPSALNIRTLEDPVEFAIPWITQIPVGAGTGRDFAGGLKSLLRQAPHVILLGELRDRSSAQTCFEAVETGHLLFATLHTRDAVGVVARLLDLGITGRQMAGGLLLAIGQRLLRRLCPACRRPVPAAAAVRRHYAAHGLPEPAERWAADGCAVCQGRGEAGFTPVFELFRPRAAAEMEDLIAGAEAARYSERTLRRLWRQGGGESLARAALRLAAAGEVDYADAAALDAEHLL
jgi:type II secretory ATPase GspE/PulE/Tfp pilus assembly ATPase PilB-like protein